MKEIIADFCRGRYARIKWLDTRNSGRGKPHFRFWEDKEEKKPLMIDDPEDVVRLVRNRNAVEFFTSVERRDEGSPDLLLIETDIGEGLKIDDPDDSYRKAWNMIKDIRNFLEDYYIDGELQPTGGRGVHLWVGEDFSEPPKSNLEILKNIGIDEENLRNLYGFNRVLGKAIAIKLLREKT